MENARTRFYNAQDKFESANETITTLNSDRHQLNQSIEANRKELQEFKTKLKRNTTPRSVRIN